MADFFKSRLFWISLCVVIVASTLPFYVSGYILGLLTVAYYFGVFAMAWDLLFGFAGEVNFGPTFEQNVTFALPHADRVYVLEHARIVWEGDPGRFAAEAGEGYL